MRPERYAALQERYAALQERYSPGQPTGCDRNASASAQPPPSRVSYEELLKKTIPMLEERRSLNLSTAVGIAAYEALRQLCV